jgi:uncharacterized membrane protein YoaK (UPF0700 family)
MSGDTPSAGLHIGQPNLAAAERSLLPIPFFVLGIFVFLLGAVLGAPFAARLANWTLLLPAFMLVVFATLEGPAISGV